MIQTTLMAFSMKMSRTCTVMFSSENDYFKFLKSGKNIKKHVHHVHHSSRACETILSLLTSLSLTRNMNVKVAIEL